jgi:tight adherence protein C
MDLFLVMLTFACVATIILTGYYAATAESPIDRRMKALSERPALLAAQRKVRARRDGTFGRRLLALLGQFGFGGDEASLAESLTVAGIRGANAARLFVGLRTLVSVVPALALLVPAVAQGRPLGRTLLTSLGVWALGHMAVNTLLRRRARMRRRQIAEALPDSLDLMVVCLEAGLGLNATIARVGDERSKLDDPLGNEFAQVAGELREGRSREDALRALGARNGVDDLKALVALVIQSDKLGASMGETLRSHADMLRTKRRQRLEEQARKLPIKMLFPLAFFVLPPLFVITLGPALLLLREFFGHMGPNH